MSEQFQAALIGYDEGLLLDDKVLAGALWRRFFQRNCKDPEHLERLVHYIRKQVTIKISSISESQWNLDILMILSLHTLHFFT